MRGDHAGFTGVNEPAERPRRGAGAGEVGRRGRPPAPPPPAPERRDRPAPGRRAGAVAAGGAPPRARAGRRPLPAWGPGHRPALTALEVAAALPVGGSELLDRALQRHVTFPELISAYHRALGCTGAARMRALVSAGADRADSGGERALSRCWGAQGATAGFGRCRSGRGRSTWPSLPFGSPSSSTAGRGTSTPSASRTTGTSRTRWSPRAGRCCDRPGTTSTTGPMRSSRAYEPHSLEWHDHPSWSGTVDFRPSPSTITDHGPGAGCGHHPRTGPAGFRGEPRPPAVRTAPRSPKPETRNGDHLSWTQTVEIRPSRSTISDHCRGAAATTERARGGRPDR